LAESRGIPLVATERAAERPHWDRVIDRADQPRAVASRIRLVKRLLLVVTLVLQPWAYKVLTEARYEVQGLTPQYFRITTTSDVLSLTFALLSVLLIVAAIIEPRRISLARSVVSVALAGLLLWLDFGVRRLEASEFSPLAAVVLVLSMCGLLATLMTRSRPILRPVKRVWRIVLNALTVFLVAVTFAFFFSFTYPTYTEIREITAFEPDAGVVLGAAVWRGKGLGDRPSPTLRQRIEVGYELLSKNVIPRIVVTGASAPGEQAEAEVAKKDLISRGVDPAEIVEETQSHTTLEQVRYLREELKAKQTWDRFVIISDQYHLARVIEMCRFEGLHAIGSPSRIEQPFVDLLYYRARESVALLAYWLLGK
jgi:vancomycin permeability regulator SanA